MEAIKEALTFDDVLLLPSFSNILPSDTDYNTIDYLLIDLIYKLSDSLAGEIPKIDIIDLANLFLSSLDSLEDA